MPVDKPTAKITKQKRVCFKFLDRFAYAKLNCKAACKFASSLQIWTSQVLRSTKIPLTLEFLLCGKNFKRLHTQLLGKSSSNNYYNKFFSEIAALARRQQNQWLVKNPICRKFAHETNPCAKIVNKFAREFAHMRFPSLQRLNLL